MWQRQKMYLSLKNSCSFLWCRVVSGRHVCVCLSQHLLLSGRAFTLESSHQWAISKNNDYCFRLKCLRSRYTFFIFSSPVNWLDLNDSESYGGATRQKQSKPPFGNITLKIPALDSCVTENNSIMLNHEFQGLI